jgi:hypothetical protein
VNYANEFSESVTWLVNLSPTINGASKWQRAKILWKILHSHVWHLDWGDLKAGLHWKCQPEHLHTASPCGMDSSQHSGWVPKGRL